MIINLNADTMKRSSLILLAFVVFPFAANAQSVQLKYSNFDNWITRDIKESKIIGGATKTIYEIGPSGTWNGAVPYVNQGGSPWANSNIMAKVAGVTKSNISVFREKRGNGYCARMTTHVVGVKVLGLVNVHVLAAGSIYVGNMMEPITSSSNPMRYLDYGIPFTVKPSSIQFDYKVKLSGKSDRIRQTGFSPVKTIPGMDHPSFILLLQKRWEDSEGNIYAKRIGTAIQYFTKETANWVNGAKFKIYYGDITGESYYKPYMNLFQGGDDQKYALNSKGKMVPVREIEWGDANDTPTHLCLQFASSHGGAYIGAEGTTLWLDNVKFNY